MSRKVLVAVLAVCVACGSSASTTGVSTTSPERTVVESSGDLFPVGVYGAGWSSVGARIGYLEFANDGTGSVRGSGDNGPIEIPFSYIVADDEVVLTSTDSVCGPDVTGTYRWSNDNDTLDLASSINDPCIERSSLIAEWSWYPLGDVPIMLAEPTDSAVAVASAIGEITWRVVAGQLFHSPPIAFGDGFAALIVDGPDARVMISRDGLAWESIPSPPITPAFLAARGDELFATGSTLLADAYVTTDLGAKWTRLTIDPPSADHITELQASQAGLLMLTEETRPVAMPTGSGAPDDRTVRVTVSGVASHTGDDLAVVLYEGAELPDLDRDALGGFWSVVTSDDFTATDVVREPGAFGEGPFPYVSTANLTVEPGTYTAVIWVDTGLGHASRWVPLNTDGRGLFGCQQAFEVDDAVPTELVVTPVLQPSGWNTDCTTGEPVPLTDADAPLRPQPIDESIDGPITPETSLWVLAADTFEHVPSAPAPIHTILALDSGYYASSSFGTWDDEAAKFWTSNDGHTWTQAVDVPRGLFVQSSFQNNVYGATQVDWGVTSTDGGRTWSEPTLRPGGPGDWLAVGDAGYFAVETALFGPPVGVVWASPDDITWQRVLNPWPAPFNVYPPVLSGNTVLINSETCDPERDHCERLDWIGVIK